nr:hypothetical protein CFP56_07944 [Quercus suber]
MLHSLLTASSERLNNLRPPHSPTTLHFRGVSFDVVNPHQSLSLETKAFETPAEIDGLLDDYFHSTESTTQQIDEALEEMFPSQDSPSSSDGTKRPRALYTDAETARSQILRLASGDDARQFTSVTGMPLIDSDQPDTGDEQEGSVHSHCHFSNPFDLHLSAGIDEPSFDHIDHMVASGHAAHVIDEDDDLRPAPLALGDRDSSDAVQQRQADDQGESADAETAQSEDESARSYSKLLDGYNYARPGSDVAHSRSPPSSIEHIRGTKDEAAEVPYIRRAPSSRPMGDLWPWASPPRTSGASTYAVQASQTGRSLPRSDHEAIALSLTPRLGQLPGPPPSRRAATPPVRVQASTLAENTEIPSSHQTYGSTGKLLDISPHTELPRRDGQQFTRFPQAYDHTQTPSGHPRESTNIETQLPNLADDWFNPTGGANVSARDSIASSGVSDMTDSAIWEEVDITDHERDPISLLGEEGPGSHPTTTDAYYTRQSVAGDEDVARIVALIKKKLMANSASGQDSTAGGTQRQRDADELRDLRFSRPIAFQTAQEIIAAEYPNMSTPRHAIGESYMTPPTTMIPTRHLANFAPQNSYEHIILASQRMTSISSLHSAMTNPPAVYNQGLRFSPSQNTFATVRDTPSPLLRPQATVAWDPLGPGHHNPARDPDAIELVVAPAGRRGGTRVTSQTQLRPLRATAPGLPPPVLPTAGCARGWRPLVHSAACPADCGHALLDPRLVRAEPRLLQEQREISDAALHQPPADRSSQGVWVLTLFKFPSSSVDQDRCCYQNWHRWFPELPLGGSFLTPSICSDRHSLGAFGKRLTDFHPARTYVEWVISSSGSVVVALTLFEFCTRRGRRTGAVSLYPVSVSAATAFS